MSGPCEPPPRHAGDEDVGGEHRHARRGGRDAEQRQRREITGRAAVTDGGIKKCNGEDRREQENPVDGVEFRHDRR